LNQRGRHVTRIALIIASVLIISFVVTLLGLVAVRDPLRFTALLMGSLLVPGAVFAAAAVIRRRRVVGGRSS
jgi:hypothetical protein